MDLKSKLYGNLPTQIKDILNISEGWLVGGSPAKLLEGQQPRDYDIIVPNRECMQKLMLFLRDVEHTVNTYGGFKFDFDAGYKIDIWGEELSHFLMTANKVGYVYNVKRNILLKLQ